MTQKGRFAIYEDSAEDQTKGTRGERVTSVTATVVGRGRGREGPVTISQPSSTRAKSDVPEPGLK